MAGTKKVAADKREPQTSLRLPREMLQMADELAEKLQYRPDLLAWQGAPTRSAVLRLALGKGLEELRKEVEGLKKGK